MQQTMSFAEVLETIEKLSLDEQEILVGILHRRIAERGRRSLTIDVQDARQEFAEGRCKAAKVEELMKEIKP